MRFAALLLLLVILLLGASPAASQVADDKLIVPGTRIGKWTLDMPIPDLMRTNGPVSARPSIVSAFLPGAAWYSWDPLGVAAGTHDRRKIAYLAIYQGREYLTQRAIGHGASRRTVLSAYGEPTLEGDIFVQGRIVTILAYDKIGLAFFLHEGMVEVLLVFRPGEMGELIVAC